MEENKVLEDRRTENIVPIFKKSEKRLQNNSLLPNSSICKHQEDNSSSKEQPAWICQEEAMSN